MGGRHSTHNSVMDEQLQLIHGKLHGPCPSLTFPADTVKRITMADALELREQILAGSVDLPQVFRVFHCRKMCENNEHRALTEVLYEKPLQRAVSLQAQLDARAASPDDLPLLGFVMSIKDSNRLKGTASTYGMRVNLGLKQPTQPDSIMSLIRAGALITAKGNVPQAIFALETSNYIFGTTTNPHNTARCVGGSTGGDAALIALGCVNAALGSDIAGSTRIPALCCGIVGFKPTLHRISSDQLSSLYYMQPYGKTMPTRSGVIRPVVGPMARSVRDVETLMRVMSADASTYDRYVAPVPWRPHVALPPKIGVLRQFSQLEVSPTHSRALDAACEALKASNVELVELNFDDFFEDFVLLATASFFQEEVLAETFGNNSRLDEPLIPPTREFGTMMRMPHALVALLARAMAGDRNVLFLRGLIKARSLNSYALAEEITELCRRFTAAVRARGVQMLLTPGMASAAVRHDTSGKNNLQTVYLFMFNVLEWAAGVVPVTRVRPDEQVYVSSYEDELAQSLRENAKDSEGLPVGVQVAGMPWMDEEVLRVMREIEHAVQFKGYAPH